MSEFKPFTLAEMEKQTEEFHAAAESLNDIMIFNFSHIQPYVISGMGIEVFSKTLNQLGQPFNNIPAVIVGAGPSLDKHIELLKQYKDDILILCLDAALPILDKHNIKPNLIVATDHSTRQVGNFKDIDVSESFVCLSSYIHPLTFDEVRRSRGKVFWYHMYDPGSKVLFAIRKMGNPSHGSIFPLALTSGSALQIAIWIGCRTITFIGHDLSYPTEDHPGYADGVTEEKVDFQKASKFSERIEASDIYGKKVLTHSTFLGFRNCLMREFWPWTGVDIYNSSECGLLHSRVTSPEGEEYDTGRIHILNFIDFLSQFSVPGCSEYAMSQFSSSYQFKREINCNIIPAVLKGNEEGGMNLKEEIIEHTIARKD